MVYQTMTGNPQAGIEPKPIDSTRPSTSFIPASALLPKPLPENPPAQHGNEVPATTHVWAEMTSYRRPSVLVKTRNGPRNAQPVSNVSDPNTTGPSNVQGVEKPCQVGNENHGPVVDGLQKGEDPRKEDVAGKSHPGATGIKHPLIDAYRAWNVSWTGTGITRNMATLQTLSNVAVRGEALFLQFATELQDQISLEIGAREVLQERYEELKAQLRFTSVAFRKMTKRQRKAERIKVAKAEKMKKKRDAASTATSSTNDAGKSAEEETATRESNGEEDEAPTANRADPQTEDLIDLTTASESNQDAIVEAPVTNAHPGTHQLNTVKGPSGKDGEGYRRNRLAGSNRTIVGISKEIKEPGIKRKREEQGNALRCRELNKTIEVGDDHGGAKVLLAKTRNEGKEGKLDPGTEMRNAKRVKLLKDILLESHGDDR